jgi:hypothetical protein
MAWQAIVEEDLDCVTAGGIVQTAIFEMEPGSSAEVEVLRNDTVPTPSQVWRAAILLSLDGTTVSQTPTPTRSFGFGTKRVIFSVDSIGARYFAVQISNGDLIPTNIIKAKVKIMADGLSL